MEIKLKVTIKDVETVIQIQNDQGELKIVETNEKVLTIQQPVIYFLLKENEVIYIGKASDQISHEAIDFNEVIFLTPPDWEVELAFLEQQFIMDAKENGIQLIEQPKEEIKIPASHKKTVNTYKEEILLILEKFGYKLHPKPVVKAAKPKPAKARHKWSKEVSQIEFFVDTRESKATVIWQKRNEMLIKAGAIMMQEAPLNKDGSVGFSAKMGDKIRTDNAEYVKDFVTTKDMILKSVNEVGLFLYFAGTNSWLELIDENGKSIDAWTRVDE